MAFIGHLMSNGTPEVILRTLHEAGYDVAPRYLPRFLKMMALSLPMHPFGAMERVLHHRTMSLTELAGAPVFILGHWRTGSTHIHNLMSQDAQFGYLDTFGAIFTNNVAVGGGAFKALLRRISPTRRPMDDMAFAVELPQEEEFAMANISSLSYYKQYSFPKLAGLYARRHIFFDDVPQREIDEWKRSYDFLLRQTTHRMGQRPLLLKNPPNTARLRHLLDLYPDARVIYLHRAPYDVYLSTLRMREKVCNLMKLHDVSAEESSEHILDTYPRLVGRFFADLPRVRPGNFVALSYEDLKAQPLAALQRIYETLGLSGFGSVRERFAAYLETVADFRPATYRRDDAIHRLVEQRWGETHALHAGLAPS
jgi:hypothetical protein